MQLGTFDEKIKIRKVFTWQIKQYMCHLFLLDLLRPIQSEQRFIAQLGISSLTRKYMALVNLEILKGT